MIKGHILYGFAMYTDVLQASLYGHFGETFRVYLKVLCILHLLGIVRYVHESDQVF